jgi:hypothetical protein
MVFLGNNSLTARLAPSLGLAALIFLFVMVCTGRFERFLKLLLNSWHLLKGACLKSLGIEIFIFSLLSLLGAGIVLGILNCFFSRFAAPHADHPGYCLFCF